MTLKSKKVSILIPTYEGRSCRLLRTIDFILRQISDVESEDEMQVIIGDGSYKSTEAELRAYVSKVGANKKVLIRYLHMPGRPPGYRIQRLCFEADTDYIQYCGDEDFPVLHDTKHGAEFLNKNDDYRAVGGVSLNLKFSNKSFRLCLGERPHHGFDIDGDLPISRVCVALTANALGVAPIFYMVQPRRHLIKYFAALEQSKETIYGGGSEMLHHVFTALEGKIKFGSLLGLSRDQTYHNYVYQENREAPETDEFPYWGKSSVELAARLIVEKSDMNFDQAMQLMGSLLRAQKNVQGSRQAIVESLDRTLEARAFDLSLLETLITVVRNHLNIYR
jgi:glycosyltransferase domain-containing protein